MPLRLVGLAALIYWLNRKSGTTKDPRKGTVKYIDGVKYKWSKDLEHKGRYTWVPASQIKRKRKK